MRKATDEKKLRGAVISAVVMVGVLLAFAIGMIALCFAGSEDAGGILVLVITAGIFLAMAVGVLIALAQRKKELDRGEEDDAKKY